MSTAPYPVLPIAAGTLARVFAAVLASVVLSSKAFARALRHRREAQVLARLDRHMLADIGLTRSDVQDAFSAPLWQDPTALLRERAIERRMGRSLQRTTRWSAIDSAFRQPATDRPSRQAI
ncbi:MAG: DUF1127 domain-containing protein [Rhodopseudomonas sp.]|nr:DUF1127 domain-containing protein [Rhodopseudomonas sp.]